MTFLGDYALRALDVIGSVLAILFTFIIVLCGVVWGCAFIYSLLTRAKPPKRMVPRCAKCDSVKVFGEPGHRVCTNCGAVQSEEDLTWH